MVSPCQGAHSRRCRSAPAPSPAATSAAATTSPAVTAQAGTRAALIAARRWRAGRSRHSLPPGRGRPARCPTASSPTSARWPATTPGRTPACSPPASGSTPPRRSPRRASASSRRCGPRSTTPTASTLLPQRARGAADGRPVVPDAWPDFAEPAALRAAQAAADPRLIAFCDRLTPPTSTARSMTDRGADGLVPERLDAVLAHLFQHQIHHRGQAHAMLAGTDVAAAAARRVLPRLGPPPERRRMGLMPSPLGP